MKISVIVPFYNTKHKYLKQLFDAITSVDCTNFEFIFINDGSSQETSALVEEFCKSNEFVYYKFDKNYGVSNARNKGIDLSSNNHIMFLDSDDLMDFSFLNNNSWNENVDLIMFTDRIFFDNAPIISNQNPTTMNLSTQDISLLYFNNSDGLNLRSSCCKILNKKLINKYNLRFDANLPFYEDAMFMSFYYSHVRSFEAFVNALYYYRIYNASSSKRYNNDYIKKYQLFFDKYYESFNENINYINALYKDTFFSVLFNKFTRSIKSFHLSFAYKLMKSGFVITSSKYVNETSDRKSFDYKLSKQILEKKYINAYFNLFFRRIRLSFNVWKKKLFK